MSNSPISLTVEPAVVEGVIAAQVKAAIVAQFASAPAIIDKIVHAAITQRVDGRGEFSSNSYDKQTLIDYLSVKAIKVAVEQAVNDWVEDNRAKIKAAVGAHLKKSQATLIKAFMESTEKALSSKFYVECKVAVNASDDR